MTQADGAGLEGVGRGLVGLIWLSKT